MTEMEQINRQIKELQHSMLDVVNSNEISTTSKREILTYKKGQLEMLLEDRQALGWTKIRDTNLIIMQTDELMKSIEENQDLGFKVAPIDPPSNITNRFYFEGGKKYNKLNRILNLLYENDSVQNYSLTRFIGKYKGLNRRTYLKDQQKYNNKIKNKLRTLNKYKNKTGYIFKFSKNFCSKTPFTEITPEF